MVLDIRKCTKAEVTDPNLAMRPFTIEYQIDGEGQSATTHSVELDAEKVSAALTNDDDFRRVCIATHVEGKGRKAISFPVYHMPRPIWQ